MQLDERYRKYRRVQAVLLHLKQHVMLWTGLCAPPHPNSCVEALNLQRDGVWRWRLREVIRVR